MQQHAPSQHKPLPPNNPRDAMSTRNYSSEDLSSGSQNAPPSSSGGKEQSLREKANLVVQHFFTKAALIICSSRVSLPPALSRTGEAKIDRWVCCSLCLSRINPNLNPVQHLDRGNRYSEPRLAGMEVYGCHCRQAGAINHRRLSRYCPARAQPDVGSAG
jgi:hypothetical protein